MKFLKKIFSTLSLTFSFLLLIYIFFKSEIYWSGSKKDYYFYYYIFAIILIIFSLISFILSEKIKEYLIIITITVTGCFYTFELLLIYEVLNQKNLNLKKKLYKEKTGKEFDTRNKYKVYETLRKENKNATIIVPPNTYLNKDTKLFPLSGLSLSQTINCNENGYYSSYQSDRYGFNNPDDEWESNQIEYLIIGDSFAQGACVNKPYDIASVIRDLSKKTVLNLGYGANGPLLEYATLKEYLDTNVKKILWIYYEGNDVEDLADELKNKTLLKYLNNSDFSQDLKFKQKQVNEYTLKTIKQKIESEHLRFKIFKFLKLYNLRSLSSSSKEPRLQKEFKKIAKLIHELSIKNNSELYFIYLPVYFRYNSSYDDTNYLLIKKIINDLQIPFIDIHTEVFMKEKKPLKLFPFGLVGHYNVSGYNKVGRSIYELTQK